MSIFLTIAQAAIRYGLTEKAIRNRIERGTFAGVVQAAKGCSIRIDRRLADAQLVRQLSPAKQRELIGSDWRTFLEDEQHV